MNNEVVSHYKLAEDGKNIVVDGKTVSEFTRGTSTPWIPTWNIHYRLGYDGISIPTCPADQFHQCHCDAGILEYQETCQRIFNPLPAS